MLRQSVLVTTAVALGFASPWLADDFASVGGLADLWFFGIASGALDLVSQSTAWLATGFVYTLQYLAVFAVIDACWRLARAR